MKNLISLGLKYENHELWVLDQTKLPHEENWIHCTHPEQMVSIIHDLKVRGAPLIGVAAALSLADFAEKGASDQDIRSWKERLKNARPTAVNLTHAIDRMKKPYLKTAQEIFDEDVELCQKLAEFGAPLIENGDSILTHCNTGGLATAGGGTALGVIQRAHEQGKKIHVYVDETRPLLQGARLTTWELEKLQIPYTLICDNMAATLMAQGKIQKVFLGADRIALNGDFANKIGTYSVAVNAHFHGIPFYTVAPITTVDPKCETGRSIPIEQRNAQEVRRSWSPENAPVENPSFDVTPARLLSGIVLDNGFHSTKEIQRGSLQRCFP